MAGGVPRRAWIPLALVTVLLAANGAGASSQDRNAGSAARAYGVRVAVPGQAGGGTATVAAPTDTVQFAGGFSCCGATPFVTTGSVTASASADAGPSATGLASAQVNGITLFGGEVTIASVTAKAHAVAATGKASGDLNGSDVSGFVVNGQGAATSGRVALGDWGYANLMEQGVAQSQTPTPNYRAFVTAVDIHLTADHDGLPANTEVLIGYAEASAQAGEAVSVPTPPAKPKPKPKPKSGKGNNAAPEPNRNGVGPVYKAPPDVHPKLTAGQYVFPVYGPSSFVDTFGAPRADVSWHHGDDIFAPLGAPVLAVADGTVFSVGWNAIGGNRLWLRDHAGNEFYYAHLSAFTPLAVNGAQVQAGDVLGFVGNTGDAQGTPYHLHFEIHPVGLLALGYDGAVDPTLYLTAWEHLQDVRFDAAAGWAPSAAHSTAPPAGAILLQVSDISSANGLEPGSLRKAFLPVAAEGDGALIATRTFQPSEEAARGLAAHR